MKNKILLFCLAIIALATSCVSDNDSPAVVQGDDVRVFTTKQVGAATRTSVIEDGTTAHIVWNDGDRVMLFQNGEYHGYNARVQNDEVTFVPATSSSKKLENTDGSVVYAMYNPNTNMSSIHIDGSVISFENSQTNVLTNSIDNLKGDILFAMGTIKDGELNLQFKHMMSMVRIRIPISEMGVNDMIAISTQVNQKAWPISLAIDVATGEIVENDPQYYSAIFIEKKNFIVDEDYYVTYVPVLPQQHGEMLHVLKYDSSAKTSKSVGYRAVPTSGLKPGVVYAINYSKEEYETSNPDDPNDGKVVQLQAHKDGNGIPLVFMGEGFTSSTMDEGGKYEQVMRREMERFFDVEPYRTYRDLFDCYMVKAVSKSNDLYNSDDLAFNEEKQMVENYWKKIGLPDTEKMRVIITYNAEYFARSYTQMWTTGDFITYDMNNHPNLVCHEAGGHGFAHLFDEYIEGGNEKEWIPETGGNSKTSLDQWWNYSYGGANVDYHATPEEVHWSKFLTTYKDLYEFENLGIYQGAYTWGYGAYRPTVQSLMNNNNLYHDFNTPSREQIFYRIMEYAYGDKSRNTEAFIEYDAKNRATSVSSYGSAATRSVIKPLENRPPIMHMGSPRE